MTTYNKSMGRRRSDSSFHFSDDRNASGKITLYEELRLIERNEGEINVIWKGAHMTLFFMAFVFGSFCTCCFHMLMHMFDNKCVLFPKVISHSSITHIIREFFSIKMDMGNEDAAQPVEYLSTQWAESSVCYLPTYVPLVSGLAGLVWTTMFFMCSSGTSNVTGAQRHWRALPLMFVFSVAMAALCIYASSITHSGLRELCLKLAEVTGGTPFSYTINVATLAYERRIRGVYQATRLSIASAWLHTTCWVLSALLVVARVLLAVDFTLVRVKAQLIGNLDDMLQKYEKQVDCISAELSDTPKSGIKEDDSEEELYAIANTTKHPKSQIQFKMTDDDTLDKVIESKDSSELSLVPAEKRRLEHKFITKLLNNLVNNIEKPDSRNSTDARRSTLDVSALEKTQTRMRLDINATDSEELVDSKRAERIAKEFMRKLHGQLAEEFKEFEQVVKSNLQIQGVTPDADNRRLRLHSSDDDETKITEDHARKHEHRKKHKKKDKNIEDRKTDKKDGTNTDTVRKHIGSHISDESGEVRKVSQENEKEKSAEKEFGDNGSIKTEEKDKNEEKAGYSGFKRTPIIYKYKPENGNEKNKETDKDGIKEGNKNDGIDIDKTEDIKTVQAHTPVRISDDANRNDQRLLKKESVDNSRKKEEKKDISKDDDKRNDNDQTDSRDKKSRDTKDKPH